MSGATAPGPGPGLPEGSTPCSRSAGHSPGSPGMGRTQSRFGGLWPRWPGPRQEGTSPDGRPPGRLTPRDLQRAFSPVPKPQERDRLKHAGRLGEGQAVKAVRNGGGGTKRGWNPATRNVVLSGREGLLAAHWIGGWPMRRRQFDDRCRMRVPTSVGWPAVVRVADGSLGSGRPRPWKPTERPPAPAGTRGVRNHRPFHPTPGKNNSLPQRDERGEPSLSRPRAPQPSVRCSQPRCSPWLRWVRGTRTARVDLTRQGEVGANPRLTPATELRLDRRDRAYGRGERSIRLETRSYPQGAAGCATCSRKAGPKIGLGHSSSTTDASAVGQWRADGRSSGSDCGSRSRCPAAG
jgi:hypothetical protein